MLFHSITVVGFFLTISLFFPPVAVHIVAHLFNFEFFMDAQLNRNSSYLPFILSEIGAGDNASFLNPIRTNETVKYRTLYFLLLVLVSGTQSCQTQVV